MRAFIAKHWRSLLVAIGINGPSFWAGIKWVWDWASRLDLVASHARELRGFGDMLEFFTNPPPWIIFPTAIVGVLIVLWDIRRPKLISGLAVSKNRMALFAGIAVLCLIASAAFGYAAYNQYKNPPPPAPTETELHKRAVSDFRINGGLKEETETIDYTKENIAAKVAVTVWVYSDLISMAKYLVFYIPPTIDLPKSGMNWPFPTSRLTYETLKRMADRFGGIISHVDATGSAGLGDFNRENMRYSTETRFAGAIYAYYEGDLTDDERVELRQIYKAKGAQIFFRSHAYLTNRPSTNP